MKKWVTLSVGVVGIAVAAACILAGLAAAGSAEEYEAAHAAYAAGAWADALGLYQAYLSDAPDGAQPERARLDAADCKQRLGQNAEALADFVS